MTNWINQNFSTIHSRGYTMTYMSKYRSVEAMIISRLYESRERFDLVNDVIRKASGNKEFDSILMALTRILMHRSYADKSYNLCSKEGNKREGGFDIGEYQTSFDYMYSNMISYRGNFTISNPQMILNTKTLQTVLAIPGGREILEKLRWVLELNHDDIENYSQPLSVDQSSPIGNKSFYLQHELFCSVRPAEHAIVAVYQSAMKEYFKIPGRTEEALERTIHYIDSVRKDIKNNAALEEGKRNDLAMFMLNRYMSPFLYNTPVRDFSRKMIIDGTERSVDDALKEFGLVAKLEAPVLEALCRKAEIIGGSKEYPSCERILKVMKNAFDEELLDEGYMYYTAKQIYESTTGKPVAQDGSITVTGIDALYCNFIINASEDYDYSHFWAHQFTKVPFMPPGFKGEGKFLDSWSREVNTILHKKLGGRAELTYIEAGVIHNKLWESYVEGSQFAIKELGHDITRLQQYVSMASQEIREYFEPKLERFAKLQKEQQQKRPNQKRLKPEDNLLSMLKSLEAVSLSR